MWHPIKHLQTVCHHRRLVRQHCFRLGLYWQGLTHDLSKFSPTEFLVGAKYWQGDHSPNEAERDAIGLSTSWLHHKGRNKHHLEYWIDYTGNNDMPMDGCKMPLKYVAEMICDRMAAGKTYKGDQYTDASAWEYYQRSIKHYLMHPETRALTERLLLMLKDEGEEKTFSCIREMLQEEKRTKKQARQKRARGE